jgi:hypothetical protein
MLWVEFIETEKLKGPLSSAQRLRKSEIGL